MYSDDNPANAPATDSGVNPTPAPPHDAPASQPPASSPAPAPAPSSSGGASSAAPSAARSVPHPDYHAPRPTRPPLREENTIFIGKKPTMGYVLAVVTQFQGGSPLVRIKARGQIISKAVDVAEIVRHKFLTETKLGPVSISTQEVENEDGTKSKVSCIEIVLLK